MGVGLKNLGRAKRATKVFYYLQKNKDCAERCSPYSIIS